MARPRKNQPVWISNSYYVQLRDAAGKRHSYSLRTDDLVTACKRYDQGMKNLLQRIRVTSGKQPREPERLPADAIGRSWELNSNGEWVEKAITWAEVAEPDEIKRTTWDDLKTNAEVVRRRKTGSDYAPTWQRSYNACIKHVPFQPHEATPEAIRRWIDSEIERGCGMTTIANRAALLSGLIKTAITSGYDTKLNNGFTLVDTSAQTTNHIATASLEGMRVALNHPNPAIQLAAATGMRRSEIVEGDYSEEGWVTISDAKTKAGNRRIPIPTSISIPTKWGTFKEMNLQLKQAIGEEYTMHSLRHGWRRACRGAQVSDAAAEFMMGHSLGKLAPELATYGNGYPDETLIREMSKVWSYLGGKPETQGTVG